MKVNSARQPYTNPSPLQFTLQLSRIRHSKVKDTSRERRIRPTSSKHLNKVTRGPRPTRRNHGNLHRPTHHRGQLTIEPTPHPIGIHRSQQNLPGPPFLGLTSPIQNPPPRSLPTASHKNLSLFYITAFNSTSIDSHNHCLRSKAPTNLSNQLRPRNRR